MGVMQALVSFVQDAKDNIRSIIAGQHKFVFLVRDHLILVGVTRGMDSTQQMLLQLMYVYNQVSAYCCVNVFVVVVTEREGDGGQKKGRVHALCVCVLVCSNDMR